MNKKRFLIIDDDEFFCLAFKRSLKRRNFEVFVAHTTEEALQQTELHRPDFATIDLKLAELSGLQLLPQILQIHKNCKALILTGYSSISTAVEAIKLGAINYLCKPINADEVLSALQQNYANPDIAIAKKPPSVNRLTWEHIQRVLMANDNNISATARSLGMHRRTLQRKLQKRPVKQ